MSRILILLIGCMSVASVVGYWIGALYYEKCGKDKKTISKMLIERLKE